MKKKLHLTSLVVFMTVSLFAQDAKSILNQVRNKYQSQKKLCAQFEQVFHWQLADETQTTKGQVCTQEGKKFRIETEQQIIVTDDKTVWTLNKLNKQVNIDHADNTEQDNPFLQSFFEKYTTNYDTRYEGKEEIEGKSYARIVLTTKSPDAFIHKVEIWVDDNHHMKKVVQTDLNENTTTYIVSSLNENPEFPNNFFQLEIPPDYEVVDLR